jgi:hypothetical protein
MKNQRSANVLRTHLNEKKGLFLLKECSALSPENSVATQCNCDCRQYQRGIPLSSPSVEQREALLKYAQKLHSQRSIRYNNFSRYEGLFSRE